MKNRPNGWVEKKLGDICLIHGGMPAPKEKEAYAEGEIPFIKMQDLGRYHLTLNLVNTRDKINKGYANNKKFKLIKKGTILLPRSGSVSLNHRAILGVDAYMVSHICALEVTDSTVYNKFLYYVLSRYDMRKIMNKTTGLDAINFQDLRKISLFFPPLETQKQIVEILERVERVKEKRKRANELSAQYIKSVFYEMFKTNETINYDNSYFEIIDGDRGVNYPKSNEFYDDEYCLFLNTKNVRKNGFLFDELMFITKEKDEKLRKGKAQVNDLILTTRGTVGNIALYDKQVKYKNVRINSGMVLLRPNQSKLLSKFLFYLIQMPVIQYQFKRIYSGSAQPQLPITSLRKVKFLIPSISLQQRFILVAENLEKLKEKQKQSDEKINNLYNSLLQKAFNGEMIK